MVRSPYTGNVPLFKMYEARSVDISEFRSPESLEHFHDVRVMLKGCINDSKTLEIVDQLSKSSRWLLAHSLKKPTISFRYDEYGSRPAWGRSAKESHCLVVPAILATQ
jgi:hypothetical protein